MPKKKKTSLIEYYNLLDQDKEYHEIELKPEWLRFLSHHPDTLKKIDAIAQEGVRSKKPYFYLSLEKKHGLTVFEVNQKADATKDAAPALMLLSRELLDEKVVEKNDEGELVEVQKYKNEELDDLILKPENWSKLTANQAQQASDILCKFLIAQNDSFWLATVILKRICKEWTAIDTQALNTQLFNALVEFGEQEKEGIKEEQEEQEEEEEEKLFTPEITAIAS